jgi:hypothetical protein
VVGGTAIRSTTVGGDDQPAGEAAQPKADVGGNPRPGERDVTQVRWRQHGQQARLHGQPRTDARTCQRGEHQRVPRLADERVQAVSHSGQAESTHHRGPWPLPVGDRPRDQCRQQGAASRGSRGQARHHQWDTAYVVQVQDQERRGSTVAEGVHDQTRLQDPHAHRQVVPLPPHQTSTLHCNRGYSSVRTRSQ